MRSRAGFGLAPTGNLAEGNADPHQVLDLAGEVYSRNPSRDPMEAALQAWDEEGNIDEP